MTASHKQTVKVLDADSPEYMMTLPTENLRQISADPYRPIAQRYAADCALILRGATR